MLPEFASSVVQKMRNKVALYRNPHPSKASFTPFQSSQLTIERPFQNIAGKGKRKKRERTGKAGKQGGKCVLFLTTVVACHYICHEIYFHLSNGFFFRKYKQHMLCHIASKSNS